MNLILSVILCFFLFFLYDYNDMKWKNRVLQCLFFAGCLLLVVISAYALIVSRDMLNLHSLQFYLGFLLMIISLAALIYTLFFALPMKETYGDHVEASARKRPVCKSGVYAICRHPGVLCMAFFYVGLWIMAPVRAMGELCITTTICNILYVWFQDRCSFPVLFEGYESYQRETPFLVPTWKSTKNAVRDIRRRGKRKHEAPDRKTET